MLSRNCDAFSDEKVYPAANLKKPLETEPAQEDKPGRLCHNERMRPSEEGRFGRQCRQDCSLLR